MKIIEIARVAHEINRAYCQALGDDSQVGWGRAPPGTVQSAIKGVEAVMDGTALTPEASHLGWAKQKYADGWAYGPTKDADAKTHPCLVHYAKLPLEQQVKDHLFLAVVRELLLVAPTQDR